MDYVGQAVQDGYVAAGQHDPSAQQEAYAVHLNQEQANAAATGYDQATALAYGQQGLTAEQLAEAAAAHAAYVAQPQQGVQSLQLGLRRPLNLCFTLLDALMCILAHAQVRHSHSILY